MKHQKLPDSEFDADFNNNSEYFEEWPENNMTTDVLGNKIELTDFQQQPIILQEELDNNDKILEVKSHSLKHQF